MNQEIRFLTKGKCSSYNTGNVGVSYKWNAITFDVRFHDTTLTRKGCFTNVANPAGNYAAAVWGQGYSDWCDARVVGSVKVDFELDDVRALIQAFPGYAI